MCFVEHFGNCNHIDLLGNDEKKYMKITDSTKKKAIETGNIVKIIWGKSKDLAQITYKMKEKKAYNNFSNFPENKKKLNVMKILYLTREVCISMGQQVNHSWYSCLIYDVYFQDSNDQNAASK